MSQHPQSYSQTLVTLSQMLIFLILTGVGFGILMAFVTNCFVIGVGKITQMREGFDWFQFTIGDSNLSFLPLMAMLVAAILIIIIRKAFSISRWHGPADSIYAAHRTDNELDVKAGFGSTLAAFVSASGGASVGQYGPLVHFGATIGSFMRQITGGKLTTDIFIGCGVAGAIAAGFNAPIAGVVFAHEAILRHFSVRAVTPIAIASISSAGISKWFSVIATPLAACLISIWLRCCHCAYRRPHIWHHCGAIMIGLRQATRIVGRTGLSPSQCFSWGQS